MTRIIERLSKSIRSAAVYNPDIQAVPACILWPDRDRQWEAIIPRVQIELPELFVLGDYDIEKRIGPAIWLRCVLAGKISIESETPGENEVKKKQDSYLVAENIPIFYLPGVGRQDLRAVESCPDPLKPLAELQYRGVIWSQINGKDLTILSFLKSDQGGLGLDVAKDNDTKNAMQLALYRLLDEDISLLAGKRLDKDYFNTLLTGGDPVRDLLQWLDNSDAFRAGRGENEWVAFVEVCKSQLAFNPQDDGPLSGAEKLAIHEGPWQAIWERYCEAPNRYPNIPAHIRKCAMPLELFANAETHGGWPQWNESKEKDLRKALFALEDMPGHEARNRITDHDKSHRERRKLVWVELGESPLALALRPLAILAEITANPLTAGSAKDLATGYSNMGWKADAAVLQALSFVKKEDDFKAVTTAIRSIYMPWVEDSARYLQKQVDQSGYPGAAISSRKTESAANGECILFVDGLRYDLAQQLSELLTKRGYKVAGEASWVALPSVTATGKPAVSPVREFIEGGEANSEFEPLVKKTGQSLKGGYHLKKLLNANGWIVLEKLESGDGNGHAWCEFGNIDHEGHERGWKLSRFITGLLSEISDRVGQLLAAGWKTVRIVTDHGWLLLPGGLPKIDLPAALVENKWGRCAVIKPGAVTEERLFPWYWNPNLNIVLANGISCFKAGEEYAHGGLSLQECLTQELMVSPGTPTEQETSAKITDVVWKGLRCKIAVDGDFAALFFDIRMKAGNPDDSVVMNVKPINENGMGSVVVENEELEGNEASIVLLDKDGRLIAQEKTIIGGGTK
ncbi:MAG: BREX-1 system phosphatase PglZ type B [Desulfosarcina sp.]|nr:BREX-1 system phosphatase PglZ type B [Desulfobacterales bacterium]